MAERLPKVIYVRREDDDSSSFLVTEESIDSHAIGGKSVSIGVYELRSEGEVVQNIHFVRKSRKRGA